MELKDIFKLVIIILGIILFFHILLTVPEYKYIWFHTTINLGIILVNIIGKIIVISIEKGVVFI